MQDIDLAALQRQVLWGAFALSLVLASGCCGRNLVRLGGGNLKALVAWSLSRRDERDGTLRLGGLRIGLLLCALWWLGGRWGLLAEHPETLERVFVGASQPQRMDGFSFVAPLAAGLKWLMYASDAQRPLHIGIVSVTGVLVGGWLAALISGQFRWETFRDAADMRRHLLGAVLITLALGSFITLAGIVTGALVQLRRDLA